uniref:Glycoprotein 4 n=1 Tax=Porcine reproductive and respiratory syndrome virus TaxID=28344 RepID=A0A0Y0AZX5_PRRSV|nr:glycoprotein 4 [Porcine reproductive and respiratory syndrome virus]
MVTAILFLLVGAQRLMVSEAFACKPCFSSHLSDIKTNTTPAAGFMVLQKFDCLPLHRDSTAQQRAPYEQLPVGQQCVVAPQYITIAGNGTDESYLYNADLFMLCACLFCASEMSEKGFKVIFGNVSGVVSACVNFTDYVAHVTQHTQQHHLVIDHVRLLHFLSPSAMRWATTIACLFAILLAI